MRLIKNLTETSEVPREKKRTALIAMIAGGILVTGCASTTTNNPVDSGAPPQANGIEAVVSNHNGAGDRVRLLNGYVVVLQNGTKVVASCLDSANPLTVQAFVESGQYRGENATNVPAIDLATSSTQGTSVQFSNLPPCPIG